MGRETVVSKSAGRVACSVNLRLIKSVMLLAGAKMYQHIPMDWFVYSCLPHKECLSVNLYLLMVNIHLTSQAGPFNLLESMHANLGVNWVSQDIAGVCRSLKY